jgi:hypothetical protein
MYRLAVDGREVMMRPPGGLEDLLLVEAPHPDLELAVALVERLAQPRSGPAIEGRALVHTDLDGLLLALRGIVLGDAVTATVRCTAESCGERVDIEFGVGAYLAHHRPRCPRGVRPARRKGWYRLDGAKAIFRLPTVGDELALRSTGGEEATRVLFEACIEATSPSRPVRARIEAAMEALAPCLFGELDGSCPECGHAVRVGFDPRPFVLRELRDLARGIHAEVHVIAARYHWAEAEILALPTARRARYAELARVAGGAA